MEELARELDPRTASINVSNPSILELPPEDASLDEIGAWIRGEATALEIRHLILNGDNAKLEQLEETTREEDGPVSPRYAALRNRIQACERYLERSYLIQRELMLRLDKARRERPWVEDDINKLLDLLLDTMNMI